MVRFPLALLVLTLASAATSAEEALPRPAGLEPNVRFWTRIYTEIDRNGGLIHDSEHLEIVYEAVRLPENLSSRARERRVESTKKRYSAALRRLASGRRSGLSELEQRTLARWPEGTSNATFRSAASRVRFQLGQADKFREGLIRAGAWMDYIEGVLADHGVPLELAVLPHVESSFNPRAYSRVGAAGLWQFTRSTGRRYMRVDQVVDERLDPFEATLGAARLLRDNRRITGSWPLAITAYNHGAAGMKRAARTLGTSDIATIVRRYKSRSFGFASRNFYCSFLAALEVDRNAELFFGPLTPAPRLAFDTVTLDAYYPAPSLARALGFEIDALREYNPALRPSVWSGAKYVPRGFELRVPQGALPAPAPQLLAQVPATRRFAAQHRDRFYKVRRGDTLSRIARRYGVRERDLMGLNNLRSRHRIRAGQVLRLPDSAGGAPVAVARAEPPPDGVYRVRRGDTLSLIAARFGVSESELARENGLRNRHRIAVGQPLRLPGHAPPLTLASAGPEADRDTPAAAAAEPAPEAASLLLARVEPAEEPAGLEPEPSPAPTGDGDGNGNGAQHTAPDPSNYAVGSGNRITVQADETLGHYAEWLEVRASTLRRLNGMRVGTALVIGRRKKLDFSRVTPETFEQRRLEYHRTLQEEFFGSYAVTGTESHTLRKGDSLWYLAHRRFRVPVWLLVQYNPDVDFGALQAGQHLVVPRVEPRES